MTTTKGDGSGRVPLVRREKAAIFSGCNSHPAKVAPAGSNQSGSGGNDTAEAFDGKGRFGRLREQAGRNASERRAGLETGNVGADPAKGWGRPPSQVFFRGATRFPPVVPPGYRRRHVCPGRSSATRETPGGGCVTQPDAREGQAGPRGESQRSIVPAKPSNAGGGKGPWFKVNVAVADSQEIGVSLILQRWVSRSAFPGRPSPPIMRVSGVDWSGWEARPTNSAL